MNHFRFAPTLLAVLAGLPVATPQRAQDLVFELALDAPNSRDCPGEVVSITLRLLNPKARAVAGYQVFLSYPTQYLEALDYQPLALGGQVFVNGRPPFGGGFAPCPEASSDPWGDGAGLDVAAVVGSAYGDGQSLILKDKSVDLGRFVFLPRGVATAGEKAILSVVTRSCFSIVDPSTRVFGARGEALEATPPAPLEISLAEGGAYVTDFLCQEKGNSVKLSWTGVAEGQAVGYRIFRDSQRIIDFLPSGTVTFEDTAVPPNSLSLRYEIVLLKTGLVEGCRASCVLERRTFLRGDANGKPGLNLSDAIAILGHLFQGQPVECEDAADVDDNGRVNITDVLALLQRLFQGLQALPPPYPDRGFDPTSDSLTCNG